MYNFSKMILLWKIAFLTLTACFITWLVGIQPDNTLFGIRYYPQMFVSLACVIINIFMYFNKKPV